MYRHLLALYLYYFLAFIGNLRFLKSPSLINCSSEQNFFFLFYFIQQIVVAVFSFVYGNPIRLINGFDSFGNTCGVKTNEKFSNFPLSGKNMNDKPYLFFLDMKEIRQTLKICVKECPKKTITSTSELYRYYKDTESQYCRYDFNMSLIMNVQQSQSDFFHFLGPCPPLPVYER